MLLIREHTENVSILTEAVDGVRQYYIEGIFMQADRKNRNGRIYPSKYLMEEVSRYNTEMVLPCRAMGELGHPDSPTINLDRTSHIIKDLRIEGADVYGRAKIMDTPMGRIVKNLIDEGVQLGVSTRGVGTVLKKRDVNEVQEDFTLTAVDVVHDPSAPGAFVNGIMEGVEWIYENGLWKESHLAAAAAEVRKAPAASLEPLKIRLFEEFFNIRV